MKTFALVDTTNQVINTIVWDGNTETWTPPASLQSILVPDDELVAIGWSYHQGAFLAPAEPQIEQPQPSSTELLATNTATRDRLLSQASTLMAPLQDAVDLGIATDTEQAQLTAWKQYRVAVARIDLTQPAPAWPNPPAIS